jgi:N-acetylneuraminate synthase
MNDDFAFATGLIQTAPWPIAQQALVIAEVGINHDGDVRIAKQLIDLANQTECDAVKFQKRTIDWFASSWDVPSQLFLRQYKLKYNLIASPIWTS